MKKMRAFAVIALVVVMLLSMTACVATEDNVIGVWSGSYVYEGNSFVRAFELFDDGTYAEICYKNGELYDIDIGTYEVSLFSVDLRADDEPGTVSYDYRFGKLVNNGHEFTKD